jgi:hypothetical protein
MIAYYVWPVPVLYPVCISQLGQRVTYRDFLCQVEVLFSAIDSLIAESLGCCAILKEIKCHTISENQLVSPVDQERGKLVLMLLYKRRNRLWQVTDLEYGHEK